MTWNLEHTIRTSLQMGSPAIAQGKITIRSDVSPKQYSEILDKIDLISKFWNISPTKFLDSIGLWLYANVGEIDYSAIRSIENHMLAMGIEFSVKFTEYKATGGGHHYDSREDDK